MDLQRIAQQFQSPGLPVRARFGTVVSVNSDRTLNVLVGGETTDADVEASFASGFSPMDATGGTLGTVTVDGIDYRTHTFTTAGTLVVTDAGQNASLDVLVIAGGGGGGGAAGEAGGGGGAGRLIELSLAPAAGSAVVAVGTAGAGGGSAVAGGDGGDSQVTFWDASVVIGTGGGGGGGGAAGVEDGRDGGSGGGGASDPLTVNPGGTAVAESGYGNDGGFGAQSTAGGGGGAGTRSGGRGSVQGNGGAGLGSSFSFISGIYCGGGGGGNRDAAAGGSGGTGGGGDGGTDTDGSAATEHGAGGGGSGRGGTYTGGNGYAGLVVFGYQLDTDDSVPIDDGTIESNEVDEVRFLGRSVPIPGQTVLLLTDGQDLLAIDSMAADGTTIAPRRYRTTNQTIPSGTGTVVEFGTAVANDLLGMDGPVGGTAWPSRLYAHIPGWYQATVGSYWGSSNNDVDTWVRYNGSTVLARQSESPDGTHPLYQSVTTPVFYMAVNDYVEMMVAHDAGLDRTLVYDSEYLPSMSLTFIGP